MSNEKLRTISSFVPALVLRRLGENQSPISEPAAERISAAVLFADITDFSSLADRLSERGYAGSEDLADLLNNCFSRIINVVHKHGGEVTKFAGDALLALWPVEASIMRLSSEARDALVERSRHAAQCAVAIQEELSNFVVDGHELVLQIGLGAGDVYSVHLGGVFARWEFLLSGDPLVQMTRATELAKPGQVVLSPEVWELIRDYCRGVVLDKGFIRLEEIVEEVPRQQARIPELSPEFKERLLPYVPAAVISRLEAGHDAWLSEHRRVTVMFIKLPAYGTSIKHPYVKTIPQAQEVMRVLQSSLYRYAGSINKLNVDDKGITLVAGLGLPPLSHKDDASRAVRAALDMQSALEVLGRPSAIGITSGWVFCGPVGNDLRREYTMVGQVVNLAARLMQAAESDLQRSRKLGAILCDDATYQAVMLEAEEKHPLAQNLHFERTSGYRVKGSVSPVQAFRPSIDRHQIFKPVTAGFLPASIVGRKKELDFLDRLVSGLAQGNTERRNHVVVVEGEAGSGKSRIVDEIELAARRHKVNTLVGAAHPLHPNTHYYAWRPIFKKLFDLDPFMEDPGRMRSRVLAQLPPVRGERGFPAFAIRLSPLLNSVLPVEFPENAHTQAMDEQERRRTTRFFLLRLLQRAVGGSGKGQSSPTLLIIENAQWLDERSWELLLSVKAQVKSLLLVLATRPLREQALGQPLSQACVRFIHSEQIEWLTLEPLSRTELNIVVCQRLGVESIPAELTDLLWQKSGGNPYFAQELSKEWLKTGHLKVEERRCFLELPIEQFDEASAPISIQKAVTGRMERLDPIKQLLLKTASVIEEPFDIDSLLTVYPVEADRAQLRDQVESLQTIGMLEYDGSDDGPKLRFKHDIIRETARSLLLDSQYRHIRSRLFS